ncbi:hypothetical protein P12x_005096 [Tundrisphaera lichenicola]|uniref:hypothetical protein n=1 Tax=Tundrisphaera lichenicola TaxID=2029860 RepID=UPI003EC00160
MLLLKLLTLGTSSLLGLALAAGLPAEPASPPDEPPPPKAKKKGDHGPGGELKKTYDILRRVRSDNRSAGRPEERLRDWTERATQLYRKALKSFESGEDRESREFSIAAHDLARAIDHARNAASFDIDDDLPPPPEAGGPEGEGERTNRDLRRAFDRINDMKEESGGDDLAFYLDAAKDLYNAAQRDATSGRGERAGELARAAEALTHVPEHLARANGDDHPEPPKARKKPDRDRPELPKEKREKKERPDRAEEIPPPID